MFQSFFRTRPLMRISSVIAVLLCGFLSANSMGQGTDELLQGFRASHAGQDFLKTHSERDLVSVIRFLNNPRRYLSKVLTIKGAAAYIDAFDDYLWSRDHERAYFGFLHEQFRSVDAQNVDILTFLLLAYRSYGGGNAGATITKYAGLFRAYPCVFIEVLKNRNDWRMVVDSLSMEWALFKEGVAKLGNSPFEKEFRAYVREREIQIRQERQSPDELLHGFRASHDGQEFLRTHSESELSSVIKFLNDPRQYFPKVLTIRSAAAYIDDFVFYVWSRDHENVYFEFLHEQFKTVDRQKAEILTFLLLAYRPIGGINADVTITKYAGLFKTHPDVFIEVLKNRNDWRMVVDSLSIEWALFKEGVAKLGGSPFEKEFRAYVLEREIQIRHIKAQ